MFVKQYGSGSHPYVCLHGWSGDHRTFEPLAPLLPPQAALYALDLPGCGSSAPPTHWTLEALSAQIASELARFNRPVTLVGNCMGALLAIHAVLHRQHLARRLILIDTFASWPWYFRVFTAPHWGRYAYASTFANPAGRWLANRSLAARRAPGTNLTEGFATVNHEISLRYLQLLRAFPAPAAFTALELPIDLIHGARSFRAVRHSAQRWREVWPWARTWQLEGACHLPIREATAALGRILFEEHQCRS